MPVATAYIGSSFPPEKRGTALGFVGATYGIATIIGPTELKGSSVVATDLRAGAAMVAAGLKAEGKTTITNVEHILRGYEQIIEKLTNVGAKITLKEI